MAVKPFPADVEALIDELESTYPPRCIQPDETPEQAHRYAGASDLVAGLRARYDRANEMRPVARDILKEI